MPDLDVTENPNPDDLLDLALATAERMWYRLPPEFVSLEDLERAAIRSLAQACRDECDRRDRGIPVNRLRIHLRIRSGLFDLLRRRTT